MRQDDIAFVGVMLVLLLCLLLTGCASTGWQDVKPHYDSAHPPLRYDFHNLTPNLRGIWGLKDGSQLWAVGGQGTILHYTVQAGRWEAQTSGTTSDLLSIFGSSDGSQLWAVGRQGTILHYTVQTGRWEAQTSGTTNSLFSIFGSSDGAQLWTVGGFGTILHYAVQAGRWETQTSPRTPDPGTTYDLDSIFGSSDGSQMWAVGDRGAILHYTVQTGRWEEQSSGTNYNFTSIFGSSDGAQLWTVGDFGAILHYTRQTGRWEAQTSGTTDILRSVFGSSDGRQLWTVGDGGTILHYTVQTGRWEAQSSDTPNSLWFVFGSSDGSQLWTVGDRGTTLHYAAGRWEAQTSGTHDLDSIFGSSDGSQLWTVGDGGTILHYTVQTGRWEAQTSGTTNNLFSIFGSSDGSQLWAVGWHGTILHYTVQAGRWEAQTSGTINFLQSIFGSSDGSQLWAVGGQGTILHYTVQTGRWEAQASGTTNILRSIFGSSDGRQLWTVGDRGTILHYAVQTGRWEAQASGTTNNLFSIFASSDGARLWATGWGGTILHYTVQTGRWEAQTSGTTNFLESIFGSSDGSQLWAVGLEGTILHYTVQAGRWEARSSGTTKSLKSIFGTSDGSQVWAAADDGSILYGTRNGVWPYISEVRLQPTLSGAELQVRVIDSQKGSGQTLKLALYGLRKSSFEIGSPLKLVSSAAQPLAPPNGPWGFELRPADIDVDPGVAAHLQIRLEQETYKTTFDVDLAYDRYRIVREHWFATVAIVALGVLFATLGLLLLIRPLWILYLYRKLRIYNLVEQIDVPGIGKLLQFLLKFTILPWFVTHPRTLRAWVSTNRNQAAAAWATSLKTRPTMERERADVDVPYVALPVEVKDVSSRLLNQPAAGDLESLFQGGRSVVQIVGPGGGGKTTLAKHIGDLALAGGEAGAFKACRLPIWIDEDFTDLRAVIKGKINGWYESDEEIEEPLLDALLQNGLLLVMVDRVSERKPATRDYLSKVHRSLRCNALLITTRQEIAMEVPEQRFICPQALDSSTLLHFMTEIIRYYSRNATDARSRPFPTTVSQTDLGNRLATLIEVRIATPDGAKEIPMLPLPVVLFVSDAVTLVKQGRSLEELPKSLPDVFANYLRRINPKVPGIENGMSDDDMLRAAKALAILAVGRDYVPKELKQDDGLKCLKTEVSGLPAGVDPLRRLVTNGVLVSKEIGATTFLRFALDPVAEFLAAEAHFDSCDGRDDCLAKLLQNSGPAQGFHNALLLTMQARGTAGGLSAGQTLEIQ